jgi:hypothetical protein
MARNKSNGPNGGKPAPSDSIASLRYDSTDVKHQGARRWVTAVNHWGRLGQWDFLPCRNPQSLGKELTALLAASLAPAAVTHGATT